jgi:hypothetical protein
MPTLEYQDDKVEELFENKLHGADTDSDHNLLVAKIWTRLKKIMSFRKETPRWDLEKYVLNDGLDRFKERRGYCKLKKEALDCTLWRTCFWKMLWTCHKTGYRMNGWMNE